VKANATPFLGIFETKRQLEVPIFQRQYVWNLGQQWEPLWEDISRKFTETLEKRTDAPPHFLGSLVLDQKQTATTHVEKRLVIDGQQRLITFQIFLSTFRDFCREQKCEELANEIDSFVLNKGMMADPSLEKFKVWPTQLDRNQFSDVVTAGSKAAVKEKHPLRYRKYARKPEPLPRMVEAYLYFYDKLSEFFLGVESEQPLAGDRPLATRLEECFQVLKGALQVVVIDLDEEDDAQVIFETLNARGEPLLPADLIRNFIFLRAARQHESQEALYEEYWKKFDDEFWREEVRQGRLNRPRSDLFMQHFLASRQTVDIPIKHLFVEYKNWIHKKHPFPTIRDELTTLAQQRDAFRRLMEPQKDDLLYQLATFLRSFDISTVYPLLLFLLGTNVSDDDWNKISIILESYLVRRAVCNFTTKNYNRIFLTLTRFLQENAPTPENITGHLSGLSGESAEWPTDEIFIKAWQTKPAYELLEKSRIVYILRRLNDSYFTGKTEQISIESPLTIEHIMPQQWTDNWPLQDGSKGLTWEELLDSKEGDPLVDATRRRDSVIQTLGNLTLLTQPLNSAVSNSAWADKKPQLLQSSVLLINQQLHACEKWDEETIEFRGKELFERAKSIWPAPSSS
jgi:uncharacterized protein with ParB-like and HNH nuclease domain